MNQMVQQFNMMPGMDDGPKAVANIVPMRFWTKYKPVFETRNGARVDTGELRAEDWVEWHVKLTGNQTIPRTCVNAVERVRRGAKRIEHTDPNEEIVAIWRALEPYYENWKAGGTNQVINGTPLAVWPGVTRDVVELLSPFKIFSVEDLSMMGDGIMNKLPNPDLPMYRERAKKFLATKDIAHAVRDLDNSRAEIEALKAQMAELQMKNAHNEKRAREAEEALDEAAPEPVKRRGRPPKVDASATV